MKANTMNAVNVNFDELTHAGQCLDLYLCNTSEIYNRYTLAAVARISKAYKAGVLVPVDNFEQLVKDVQEIPAAIAAAARLVRKYDGISPSTQSRI